MAAPAKRKKKKSPGGLTGAPPKSEPRVQIFSKFGGCNFQLSPHDFDYIFDDSVDVAEQTDQMSNLMVVQNNAGITSNQTIETRQNLVKLFDAPQGAHFNGVCTLVDRIFYAACDDKTIRYGTIDGQPPDEVRQVQQPVYWYGREITSELWGGIQGVEIRQSFRAFNGNITAVEYTIDQEPSVTPLMVIVGIYKNGSACATYAASGNTLTTVGLHKVTFATPADILSTDTVSMYIFIQATSVFTFRIAMSGQTDEYPDGAVSLPLGDAFITVLDDLVFTIWSIPTETSEGSLPYQVTLFDQDEQDLDNTWTFLGYADDQLVGMTAAGQLWTGGMDAYALYNARAIPDPAEALLFADLTAKGSLTISSTYASGQPFRISLQYTLLNRFGPTLPSPPLTFYASKPTSEWSPSAYVVVSDTVADGYDTTAVELYYSEGEYQEPNFLTRVNLPADDGSTKTWSYDWVGYVSETASWLLGNLTIPTQNYTGGVPASRMASHDGQLYFWGGEPAYRIWIGGNPGNRFSVSTGTGGGFVDCEPGTGTVVRDVLKFKTTQGASIVTALCDNPNSSKEHRFNLVETNISLSNEQSAKSWQAEKVSGTVGCKSPHGAVVASDGLYAVSRYGLMLTTLVMEYNSQLRVTPVSDAIEPVFLKQYGNQLDSATLFAVNDVLYMTFGAADSDLDNVIFCYDINNMAWWTYTLDVDEPILNMVHIDSEVAREGIGIVTANAVWLLPTTRSESLSTLPAHDVLIESAELATTLPVQNTHHLSQLEFRFDYFIGELDITVFYIDQFGRTVTTRKHLSYATLQNQLAEYIRIDAVVESYKVVLSGPANFRLTHFLSKSYPKPSRIGMVWGFDSSQSHTSHGSIHRTFASYNDLKATIRRGRAQATDLVVASDTATIRIAGRIQAVDSVAVSDATTVRGSGVVRAVDSVAAADTPTIS